MGGYDADYDTLRRIEEMKRSQPKAACDKDFQRHTMTKNRTGCCATLVSW